MQSNIDCIMDDLHEFPDSWVELYNNSDESINLKEYQIGIKEGNAWQLPNKTIDAKGIRYEKVGNSGSSEGGI
jgi:hypothetical protein